MLTKVSLNEASASHIVTDLSSAVVKSKRIIVVTGAGISCSCGIPDFRSSDGFYSLIKRQNPDAVWKGRDFFDSSVLSDETNSSIFYKVISKLKRSIDAVSPSATHSFIKALDTKGKLLRSYTQNIDGLEERVGLRGSAFSEAEEGNCKSKLQLKAVKNVQLHGDLRHVRCTLCSIELPFGSELVSIFDEGKAPDCPECLFRSEERSARCARPLKTGKLRPAIVLYGEPHPLGEDIGAIETSDLARKPDMLIIMGTSLKVHGLKKLVKEFAKVVHASRSKSKGEDHENKKKASRKVIFVNKTPPASEWESIIDFHVEADTDEWVARVIDDWKKIRPNDWGVQMFTATGNLERPLKVVNETNVGRDEVSKASEKNHGREQPHDVENIAPCCATDLSKRSYSSTLSSPTATFPHLSRKRLQEVSHYSYAECSPPKLVTRN